MSTELVPERPAEIGPSTAQNTRIVSQYTVLLKDGKTTATIYPITSSAQIPIELLAFLCDEFNYEVTRGETLAHVQPMTIDAFQAYWFESFVGVMLLGDAPTIENREHWERECLGTFFIKRNFPGRSSHVCTACFLVNAGIRGQGVGRTLAECYLEWAPKLEYIYSVFSLVFETNTPMRRICEALNFKRIGRLQGVGMLKGMDRGVDALIYARDVVDKTEESVSELRFDRIRYYLETGRYPPHSDRQEKSRLRSAAAHYRMQNGKLMLKDKEVISDPDEQLRLAVEMHQVDHGGINRTTSKLTDHYHWQRIKDTVATAIRSCLHCRNQSSGSVKRQKRSHSPTQLHSDFTHPFREEINFQQPLMAEFNKVMPRQYFRSEYQESVSFEDHNNGEEIAIARALIQANETSGSLF